MHSLEDLVAHKHDVIIIGGGLIGAFIYLDCALRGLNPILIERGDFGGETTSGNTKLAHGGIRYTSRKDELPLVIESLRERQVLTKIAPHLVYDMDFILPIYDGCIDFPPTIENVLDSRSLPQWSKRLIQRVLVHTGISIYDLLGGSRFPFRLVSKNEWTQDHLLRDKTLLGIRVYSDGKIRSPERLALEAILKGDEEGGKSFNYSEAIGFDKDRAGKVAAIRVKSGDAEYTLQANVIINATGPWIDVVNDLHTPGIDDDLLLRVGGIHVAVSSFPGCEKLGKRALVIPTKSEEDTKRIVFMIPEKGCWIVGTTEKKIEEGFDARDYKPSRSELELLFDAVRSVMPAFDLTSDDTDKMLYFIAGVRPLRRQQRDPTAASRRDLVHYDSRTGVISVTGKLTPARAVAERTTDVICRLLGKRKGSCRTAKIPLYGGEMIGETPSQIAREWGVREEIAENLLQTYGSRYADVLACCGADASLATEIEGKYILAQVIYAVEREKAMRIGDVMLRRTEIGKRTRSLGIDLVGVVGELMGRRLGWSREQLRREIGFYRGEISDRYRLVD